MPAVAAPSTSASSAAARAQRTAAFVLAGLVGVKLVFHLLTNGQYGYQRDELLYRALGEHLAWGYAEVPPSIGVVAWLSRVLVGDTLQALRLGAALAGAGLVLVTGLLARAMGGRALAVGLAALCVLVAPVYLRAGTLFQPVVFDQFYWALAAYVLVRWLNADADGAAAAGRWWPVLGAVLGLALLNKHSVLILGFAILAALLLTRHRRALATPGPWLAAAVALALFAPHLVWQAAHGWPFFEHMAALRASQLDTVSRATFLMEQVLIHLPPTAVVWAAGLVFFFSRAGARYRMLGWIYLVTLAVLLLMQGKAYYLSPAYPMLFAGGAVLLERWVARRPAPVRRGAVGALVATLVAGGAALAPLGAPLLPADATARYLAALGLAGTGEVGTPTELPQDFADMHGWEEQVAALARAYEALPPEDRARVVLLASNYGEAGAIDRYGPRYGLPRAVSTSSSYYLFGPGDRPGDVALGIGFEADELAPFFDTCTLVDRVEAAWVVREERSAPIRLCRGIVQPLQEAWPALQAYQF